MVIGRPKKISQFIKSSMIFFSKYRNRKYNIRHRKLKASKEHPGFDDQIDFPPTYKRISEAKPDNVIFSIEAYIEKSSLSRYRYERYHGNKFSSMVNCTIGVK